MMLDIKEIMSRIPHRSPFLLIDRIEEIEVGKSAVGKKGIVKDAKARINAVKGVISFAASFGFGCFGVSESAITGGDGNVEYVAAFKKGVKNEISIDLRR